MIMKNFNLLFILTLIVFSIFYCKKNNAENVNFQRLAFKTDKISSFDRLFFNKKSFSWNKKMTNIGISFGKHTSKGIGLSVNNNASLYVLPKVNGTKGIILSFSVYSPNKSLNVSIIIKDNKNTLKNIKFKNYKRFTRTVNEQLKLSLDTKIIVNAKGSGMIFINKLILYDIIPKQRRKYIFVIALDNMSSGKIDRKYRNIFLTPNINKLKKDSVYFSNAFSQSSWTYPSFMSMFSGIYEYKLNFGNKRIFPYNKPFLIEQFSKKFITVSFNGGAWLQPKYGASRGFDLIKFVANTQNKSSAKTLFNKTIDFLKRNQTPSLFMFLHTYHVHSPFTPNEKFLKQLNRFPKFKNLSNFSNGDQYKKNVNEVFKKSLIELYDAEILEFDYFFGKFISYLKESGIYNQSTIVFVSDHGEEFYEHKGWFHGHSLYNELIKVPLLIKFPNNQINNRTISYNVALIDVLPTLLDFNKIPAPANIDGISLKQTIIKDKNIRRILFSTTSCMLTDGIPPKVALINDKYKIIYNFNYTNENIKYFSENHFPPALKKYEIYNLQEDPYEKNNLFISNKFLLKEYKKEIFKIVKIIKSKIKNNKKFKIDKLNDDEKKRLKTLGYL